jgi:hypothetical protein
VRAHMHVCSRAHVVVSLYGCTWACPYSDTNHAFLCRCMNYVDLRVRAPQARSCVCACVIVRVGARAYGLLENVGEGNEESRTELLDLLSSVRSLLQGLRQIKDLQSQVRFLTFMHAHT